MSGLIVAGRPTNLLLPPEAHGAPVTSDLYDMCSRVKEISDRLYVSLLKHDGNQAWVILEKCEDGVDRKLFKVRELDARILPRIREALSVPLSERLKKAEAEAKRYEREYQDEKLEEMYEEMGREMWFRFERDGFIDQRPVSYPKAGVATRGKKRGKSRP